MEQDTHHLLCAGRRTNEGTFLCKWHCVIKQNSDTELI